MFVIISDVALTVAVILVREAAFQPVLDGIQFLTVVRCSFPAIVTFSSLEERFSHRLNHNRLHSSYIGSELVRGFSLQLHPSVLTSALLCSSDVIDKLIK